MRTPEQVLEIVNCLEAEYPDADCTLDFKHDYELLFSVRLAAQCTDERVNQITPALFARYPTLEDYAAADQSEMERYVHSCGFFRAKARDIIACANVLLTKHNGKVPDTMEELVALPGVGRKTANLILGDLYKKPGKSISCSCRVFFPSHLRRLFLLFVVFLLGVDAPDVALVFGVA